MSDIEQYCPEYTIAETRLHSLGYSPSTREMVLAWGSLLGEGWYQEIADMPADDLATMVREIAVLYSLHGLPND